VEADQILPCGYAPVRARAQMAALREALGGLPAALFINSLTVFEGVLSQIVTLPAAEIEASVIGSYDHDPVASFLTFPVHMVRQNSEALVARAFELIEQGVEGPIVIEVEPELVPPRSVHSSPFEDLG
jgi:LacI family fructose operon transcriptional repressor